MKLAAIKTNKDFRTAYYRGKSQVHPALVTYARRNRQKVTRIGITTGKKLGTAVQRNRCRRVIREAYRGFSPRSRPGGIWFSWPGAGPCRPKAPIFRRSWRNT